MTGEGRTQPASAQRLDRARREGHVFFSPTATAVAALAAGFAVVSWGAGVARARLLELFRQALAQAFAPETFASKASGVAMLASQAAGCALSLFIPGALAALGVGLLINLIQTGAALRPLRTRHSHPGGIGGGGVGGLLFILLAAALLWSARGNLVRLSFHSGAAALLGAAGHLTLWFLIRLLPAAGIWAGLDWLWRRWRWRQELRMSPRELEDEARMQEGDAQLKAARQRLGRQLAGAPKPRP